MKRKPKKFLSGGEVAALAGLGYLGYKAYDEYQKGKKPEEDKGGFRGFSRLSREQTDKINPREAKEDKAVPPRDANAPLETYRRITEKQAEPEPKPRTRPDDTTRVDDKKRAAEINDIFKNVNDPNKGKYRNKRAPSTGMLPGKDAYKDSSGTIYNERGEPFADTKKVERRVMGVDKKGSTAKGRSENPIQGTIDSATKSTVRSDKDKMSERAREVQRRREEAEKSRYKKGGAVKKYASGGSVSSASKRADGIAQRGKTRGRVF
jgi:hypothetical protein